MSARLRIKRIVRRSLPIDTARLARYLVGKILVRDLPRGRMTGRIVETEAYPLGDSTSYAYRGQTPRNAPLFMERGHAYVRLIYGASYSLNLSGEQEGSGAAVLIRALEPLEGLAPMRRRRPGANDIDLARGPGRLARAMSIDPRFDGVDLCAGKTLWIGRIAGRTPRVGVTTRIGLSREQHRRLRFYALGSRFVSGPRSLSAARARPRKSRSAAPRRA